MQLDATLGHASDLGVVRHHDHGAAFAVQLIDQAHHNGLVHFVEVPRRFIRQDEPRLIDQRARDAGPLLLSARKL